MAQLSSDSADKLVGQRIQMRRKELEMTASTWQSLLISLISNFPAMNAELTRLMWPIL
jgi:hypothetical protein